MCTIGRWPSNPEKKPRSYTLRGFFRARPQQRPTAQKVRVRFAHALCLLETASKERRPLADIPRQISPNRTSDANLPQPDIRRPTPNAHPCRCDGKSVVLREFFMLCHTDTGVAHRQDAKVELMSNLTNSISTNQLCQDSNVHSARTR